MSHPAASQAQPRRNPWILRGMLLALASLILMFFTATSAHIVHQAYLDETRPADAIVVFGAAEYAGRPSPVLRARLDHAYDLFERGVAPLVITTGGAGADPTYTEGGVGRDYLIQRGISDTNLIAETQGDDTAESATRIAVILRANSMKTCVAVSDAYHIFRIKKLFEAEGMVAYGAPRPGSIPQARVARILAVLREAVSYAVWKMHLT